MTPIDISGLDWAELLFALYKEATQLTMWNLAQGTKKELTLADCKKLLPGKIGSISMDYLAGRSIKVEFRGDELYRSDLYDRDCPSGPGSCERIVARLRAQQAKKT